MSEPFSQAYIDLCTQPEVADRLREEWEPKCGDWVLCWDGDNERWGDEPWLVLSWYCEDALDVMLPDGVGGPVLLNEVIPLFQPRQLWTMLEERGYRWTLSTGVSYWCSGFHQETLHEFSKHGPDPETALLRAWLEVVSHRGKEE